ncbi:MAG: DinB family protein [Longimicrobiaceae bacterium]
MITPDRYRETVARLLDWGEAHAGFDKALSGIPPELRGVQPEGLPYSPWQLLEHLRLAQRDILDFCRDPDYTRPEWPDDYWPPTHAPASADEWSVEAFRGDRDALRRLASDPDLDLTAEIPHGEGQTYLRELLLVADHNAYHLGQLVVVRRLLGIWPP